MTKSLPESGLPSAELMEVRDSPLIACAAEGDGAAITRLLEAARPVVYRWVATRTRDSDDAEDVTQLVLLRMYSSLPDFKGGSRLSSWLYRITLNEIAGFFRREARYRDFLCHWGTMGTHDSSTRIRTEAIDHRRDALTIKEAASSLPPHQRTAFSLVDLAGLTPCEAAQELGKTQTALRSNLCRARKKIRELVEECRGTGALRESSVA